MTRLIALIVAVVMVIAGVAVTRGIWWLSDQVYDTGFWPLGAATRLLAWAVLLAVSFGVGVYIVTAIGAVLTGKVGERWGLFKTGTAFACGVGFAVLLASMVAVDSGVGDSEEEFVDSQLQYCVQDTGTGTDELCRCVLRFVWNRYDKGEIEKMAGDASGWEGIVGGSDLLDEATECFGLWREKSYPEGFRQMFIDECTTGGSATALCNCLMSAMERDLSLTEFTQLGVDVSLGKQNATDKLQQIAARCQ
jgi:hypothetical protein